MAEQAVSYDKMKPEVKKRWLEALRSGRFRQTRVGYLQHKTAFCCLGVLCKTEGLPIYAHGVPDEDGRTQDGDTELSFRDLGRFGLSWKAQNKLIDLNDSAHYSFKKIADWIEKNL